MNCKLLSNITENLFPNGFWRQGDESIKNYEQLNDKCDCETKEKIEAIHCKKYGKLIHIVYRLCYSKKHEDLKRASNKKKKK